jgi:hypothetical protein
MFQNLKAKRRQKVVLRPTKNPPRPRNKPSHAPDAVSREYRGKITTRKEYFTSEFVVRSDRASSFSIRTMGLAKARTFPESWQN